MLSDQDNKKLELIFNDKSLANYFFINAKDSKWFYPLKEKGYFNPEKAPQPIESDQKGSFQLPDWHVLYYLESLSIVCKDEDIQKELLHIIKNVTAYHTKNKFILDNYRIWWFFVKILKNIPPAFQIQYYQSAGIDFAEDLLKHWFNSKFDTSLITQAVLEELLPIYFNPEVFAVAEKIINAVTTLKEEAPSAAEADFLKLKKGNRVLGDFFWLSKSFKEHAEKIGQLCDPDLLYNLADKLKNHFLSPASESTREILAGENTLLIMAESERNEKPDKEFDFKITITKKAALKNEVLSAFELIDCKTKRTLTEAIKNELLKLNIPGIDKVNFAFEIGILYRNLYPDSTFVWYRSLDKDDAYDLDPTEGILIYALKAFLFYKCKYDPETGKKIIQDLTSYKYQFSTFTRIVLYIISSYGEKYIDFFWSIIKSDKEILYSIEYEYDTYVSLGKLVALFNNEQKKLLDDIICETAKRHPVEENASDNPKLKQKWYKAMKADPFFGPKYEEMIKITSDQEGEAPPESMISVREGTGGSPLTPDQINVMKIDDIIRFLKEYRAKDTWKESEESLSGALKISVQTNPNKFIQEIGKFLEIKYLYINTILWGFQEAIKSGAEINWSVILQFAIDYISNPDFGKPPEPTPGSRHVEYHYKWVASSAADLVEAGLKNKEKGVSEKDLPFVEALLDAIVNRHDILQNEADLTDPLTHALNTPLGKVAEAEINFLNNKIRTAKQEPGAQAFVPKMDMSRYQRLLDLKVPEAFTFFGRFLANFNYFNTEWVTSKIKEYINLEDTLWVSFFHGYLWADGVNNLLYRSLKELGFYKKGLAIKLRGRHGSQRLIQHTAIGYIRGFESLDDPESLFRIVIDRWSYEEIYEIISLFWSFQKSLLIPDNPKVPQLAENSIMRERVIALWKWLHQNDNTAKMKLGNDYAKYHSNLLRFAGYVEKITDEYLSFILLSAPYAEANFNSSIFIESLDNFTDKEDIERVGAIFLKMLEGCTPYYDKEHIKSIVIKLYKNGYKDSANKICTEYARRGDYSLRQIYEEFNIKKAAL